MHELSLAENLREIIEEEAARLGFSRVRAVYLVVGELSCVAPEALEFCFDAVMAGTLAEGARLEIVRQPGRGRCGQCSQSVAMAQLYDLCPRCLLPLTAVEGLDVRLKELEVD